ncbi:P-loop containing nucleoside triphosphate hydrolase protein [Piromyces finnis]|uniref:p-loop containing nucleoside triphosphate hydrolase protein n=1 Tax=Piromyces finnis TaxID=1754191 RepID=A0A1Y1VJM1_9FUNG|nr:P-loop containing nucleoside triphosphate hydrolase protein [Piromyces finnis]|eukprot:ORX57903.1 P-loop containing nucleoside triphosphate hydrolase protein [Piromyces finnis]
MSDSKNNSKSNIKKKEKRISFFQLNRYSNGVEKFMIFAGVICAFIQGLCMPLVVYYLGDILEILISIVLNLNIKKITGIEDENLLKSIIPDMLSRDPNKIANVIMKYPNLDFNKVYEGFQNSKYGTYDLTSKDFTFNTMDEIMDRLYKIIYLLLIVGAVAFITGFLFYYLLNISASRQSARIRSLVFKSLLNQEIEWHEKTSPGELTSRIISDTILIEDGIGSKVGTLIQNVTTFLACYAISFVSSWKLTMLMVAIIPILLLIVGLMGIILKKFTKKSQDSYALVGGIAQEAFSQIRTIASFGSEQKEIDRYCEKLKPTRKYGIIKSNATGFILGSLFGIVFSSISIIFIGGTKFIHDGEMDRAGVFRVLISILMGILMVTTLSSILNAFSEASGAAVKLFEIIERKPSINPDAGMIPEEPLKGYIQFENVIFSYPARPDVEVLKGISFNCKPGQTIALVGSSGSGKSTIVQLLERFYQKKSGRILIDNRDIEEYNIRWLRSQIGLVSQEPTLFDTSISKNISITRPDATQEEIEANAKLANAHDFILKLPNGYNTSTGERGLQLSGGQKQRICITRVLMSNPKILLLDEATSALDNQSEKIVQTALDSASENRTTIIIAHRLTTIRNADCIIVMDKGVIVESGTHDELMEKQEVYYNLVKNQEMNIEEDNEEDDDNIINKSEEEEEKEKEKKLSNEEKIPVEKINTRTSIASTVKSLVKMNNKSKSKMNWGRYFLYNKSYWWAILIGIIGSILNGIIPPLYSFVLASAINVFNEQGDDLINDGKYWGKFFVFIGIANFISYYLQFSGFSMAGENLTYSIRKMMYNSILRQEVGFFDTNSIGDNQTQANGNVGGTGTLTAKLASDAGLVQGLNNNIGFLFEIIVSVIVGFTIAFIYGWKISLILLIGMPVLLAGVLLILKKSSNDDTRIAYENSTKIACESIINIKTVYALNLEQYFNQLYEVQLNAPKKSYERKIIYGGIGNGFSNGIMFIMYDFVFYIAVLAIKSNSIEIDPLLKVVLAVILTVVGVGRATIVVPGYGKAVEAFGHVLEIIDRKPRIDATDPSGIKMEKDKFTGAITFKDIIFQYPSRPTVNILNMKDSQIDIPAGKMCAIVGGSGCGKSTIIGLLLRWYDPSNGSIIVDRNANSKYNLKWLRQQIGIVNQEPSLFNISVRDNIRYGKEDATEEEIIEAAKKANIHGFISSLPEGYDTVVGGIGTSQMSGGQKQRIAIARAIIRNPRILLLDEATSALDAESELVVQNALEEASQGRTTITIAHRLSTIKDADIIVVMKEGHIEEMGTHDQLMYLKGEYYNMVLAGNGKLN